MENPLDIQDYLDATGDSAKRSRVITIAIVIACVLVFTGLLNSLRSNWMLSRFNASSSPDSKYIQEKIGRPPAGWETAPVDAASIRYYDYRYREFVAAISRAYIDSAMLIRVPFFGIVIDVNDLGLVGGVGFLVLLIWYRFSLSREVDNLRLSFAEAESLGQLQEFYNLLAMRQVFTVPKTKYIRRTPLLTWFPKLICWLPAILHVSVMSYDIYSTADIGEALSQSRFATLIIAEVIIAALLVILAGMTTHRQRRIDHIWDEQWERIKSAKPTKSGRY